MPELKINKNRLLCITTSLIAVAFLVVFYGYYSTVSKEVEAAKEALSDGRYIEAEMRAELASEIFPVSVFNMKGNALASVSEASRGLQTDRVTLRVARQVMSRGEFEEARSLLLNISSDSHFADEARIALGEVEDAVVEHRISSAIEGVRREALAAQEAAAQARKEVEEERLARLSLEKETLEREAEIARLEAQGTDVNRVIASWAPFVVSLECDYGDLDINNRGSGTIISTERSGLGVLTNRHVVTQEGEQADRCKVRFSENVGDIDIKNVEIQMFQDFDLAFLPINQVPAETANYIKNAARNFNVGANICLAGDISSGDEIAILGYPKIGSKNDITVTRGIISGRYDEYYVTDAKIDQGNSGGAAVLASKNCLFGIPSAAAVGRVESLGRILDIRELLE